MNFRYIIFKLYLTNLLLQKNGIINYIKYGINIIDYHKSLNMFRQLYKIESKKIDSFFIFLLT